MKQKRIDIEPFTIRFYFFLNSKGLHTSTIQYFSKNLGILQKDSDLHNLIFHFTDLYTRTLLGFEELNINYYHFEDYTSNEKPMYFKSRDTLINTSIINLFLFTSPIELMSYWQLYKHKLQGYDLLISFPKIVNYKGVRELCNCYPHAKITTCFSNSMEGKINDIKVSLHKIRMTYTMKLTDTGIHFSNQKKSFELPFQKLSLYQFSLKSKIKNYKTKTHKPPNPFLTFNAIIHD